MNSRNRFVRLVAISRLTPAEIEGTVNEAVRDI